MYDILIISIATTYGLNCYKEDYDQVWNKQQEWNITKTKMLCVPSINEQEIGKMGQWCFPIKKSPALASPPVSEEILRREFGQMASGDNGPTKVTIRDQSSSPSLKG